MEKEPSNWPKARKDLEGLPYTEPLSCLFIVLLLVRGLAPRSFSGYICISLCLESFLNEQTVLCVLATCGCSSLVVNFVPILQFWPP